jgi:hypothetical protein
VPGYCPTFRGKTQLTPESAIPYAKLLLLRDLGMITADQFDGCVAGAAPRPHQGINFREVSYTHNIKAGIATADGIPYFRFMASGPADDQMLIELRLPRKDSTPVGLHRIERVPLFWPSEFQESAIYLGNEKLAKTGLGGTYVLVSDFSTYGTSGVVFDLILENAFGFERESLPYGTFSLR